MGVGGNVVDTLLVKGDADDLACGRERGQVAVIAAAAVAQARAGAVECYERHDDHVESFGRHDREAAAVDVRGREGPRGVGDKRSRGRIVGGNCPHAHALATSCGINCREHARISYAPAARSGRSGKRGRVDFGAHRGIDGNGVRRRGTQAIQQLNKPRTDSGGLRRPHIQINRIAPSNHRPSQLSLIHPSSLSQTYQKGTGLFWQVLSGQTSKPPQRHPLWRLRLDVGFTAPQRSLQSQTY